MKVKFYSLSPFWEKLTLASIDCGTMPHDEFIRSLGFSSCYYIDDVPNKYDTYWEMDEHEFTVFCLKFFEGEDEYE